MKSLREVQEYWKNPDEQNVSEKYLNAEERTDFLVDKVQKLKINKDDKILELGSNIGRNLNGLFQAGYRKLVGIEINEQAISNMSKYYFECFDQSWIVHDEISNALPLVKPGYYRLIFTMAVLCHIHPDVEKTVFDAMVRKTDRYIIMIEDEYKVSERHCPRNYREVFESRGMKEIESKNCSGVKGLGKNYIYRMFQI